MFPLLAVGERQLKAQNLIYIDYLEWACEMRKIATGKTHELLYTHVWGSGSKRTINPIARKHCCIINIILCDLLFTLQLACPFLNPIAIKLHFNYNQSDRQHAWPKVHCAPPLPWG